MKIIFLYQNKSGINWYDCKMEAWIEQEAHSTLHNKIVKSYNRIDDVSIHISKDPKRFESQRIDIDSGKDGCMGHHAKDRKEFLKDKCDGRNSWSNYEVVNERYYTRMRSVLIRLMFRYSDMDFTQFKGPQTTGIRLLDHF